MKILLEIYDILKNIKYIKRNTIAFHEYYDLYKILMKIKKCCSCLLSFISSFNHEKKQKIILCEQSCCCHALGTRKKLQNSPIRTILLL